MFNFIEFKKSNFVYEVIEKLINSLNIPMYYL